MRTGTTDSQMLHRISADLGAARSESGREGHLEPLQSIVGLAPHRDAVISDVIEVRTA